MEFSREGMAELANYEGIALKPYLDSVGVKTVGIGSTRSDIPDLALWSWNKELSIPEVVEIYKKGLSKYVGAVNKALTLLEIPQHKFDALVSICYNIGIGGMAGSTFMKRVNARDTDVNIVKAIKSWNKGGGRVIKGLVNRRQAESDLFVTGVYQSGGMVTLIDVDEHRHPHYNKRIKLLDYL